MDTNELLGKVDNYENFYTLKELDNRAFEVTKRYGFEIKKVGESFEGHPLYLIKAGKGDKNAFLWGDFRIQMNQ